MTLAQIRASEKPFLTPGDIAPVLGSDPQTIRVTALTAPERIGFPFTFTGNRMKIPRLLHLGARLRLRVFYRGLGRNPRVLSPSK